MYLDEVLDELASMGVPSTETRYVTAPSRGPFIVWGASASAGGADEANTTIDYEAVLMVVERPGESGGAREKLERALTARGLPWSRQIRYWNEDEDAYTTEYETSWSEKAPLR